MQGQKALPTGPSPDGRKRTGTRKEIQLQNKNSEIRKRNPRFRIRIPVSHHPSTPVFQKTRSQIHLALRLGARDRREEDEYERGEGAEIGDKHSCDGARWNHKRQLPFHSRCLHRPRLESHRSLHLPRRQSRLPRQPQRGRGTRLLPRFLLCLIPLLQRGGAGTQAGHPPHRGPPCRRHPPPPTPRSGRVPHPRQQDGTTGRNARLRRWFRQRVLVPHARPHRLRSGQARVPLLPRLLDHERRGAARHFRPRCNHHLYLRRHPRLHAVTHLRLRSAGRRVIWVISSESRTAIPVFHHFHRRCSHHLYLRRHPRLHSVTHLRLRSAGRRGFLFLLLLPQHYSVSFSFKVSG